MINKRQHLKYILRRRLITIAILAGVLVGLAVFGNYPESIERFYSNGFYNGVYHVLHWVFNIFPFSVGDVLYIVVIGWLVYAIVQLIRLLFKRQFWQASVFCLGSIIGIEAAILIFYLFWGMNYFRPSAAERLNLRDSTYTPEQLIKVTSVLIDSANSTRKALQPNEFKQDNATIYRTAIDAVNALGKTNPNFTTYKPDIKPSLITPLLNYLQTSGYYNPFTGEAQINYQMPVFLRPFVACHEMSHQMGFGAEDEANFAGFMAGINSPDRLLRYSTYYVGVQECMRAVYRQDSLVFKRLKKQISDPVRHDFKADRQYWLAYSNQVSVISSLFYDNFLKANNQPQGLETYNQMVRLIMAMYKKNGRLAL